MPVLTVPSAVLALSLVLVAWPLAAGATLHGDTGSGESPPHASVSVPVDTTWHRVDMSQAEIVHYELLGAEGLRAVQVTIDHGTGALRWAPLADASVSVVPGAAGAKIVAAPHAVGPAAPGAIEGDDGAGPGPFPDAGCATADATTWATTPYTIGVCDHAWFRVALEETTFVCAAESCFVDGIDWETPGFAFFFVVCTGIGTGYFDWGTNEVPPPACTYRTHGPSPTTWTKWDSQLMAIGGAAHVGHVL